MAMYQVSRGEAGRRAHRASSLGHVASESEGSNAGCLEDSDDELPLDRNGLILFGCLTGGDYDVKGVVRCGGVVAKALAILGFGTSLVVALKESLTDGPFSAPEYDPKTWMPIVQVDNAKWVWKRKEILKRMCHEVRTNESTLCKRKNPKTASEMENTFLSTPESLSVFASYIWPRTTLHKMQKGGEGFSLGWEKMGSTRSLSKSAIVESGLSPSIVRGYRAKAGFDLVAIIITLREKFGYTDAEIRQKTQSRLFDGIMTRELMEGALSDNPNRSIATELVSSSRLLSLNEARVKVELGQTTSVASLYDAYGASSFSRSQGPQYPAPASLRSGPEGGAKSKRPPENELFVFKSITKTHEEQGRLEYRVEFDDSGLDEIVRQILDSLKMPPPLPSPRKAAAALAATKISFTEHLDAVNSSPIKSPRKAPAFKDGDRRQYFASELLKLVSRGQSLIAAWETKQKQKR